MATSLSLSMQCKHALVGRYAIRPYALTKLQRKKTHSNLMWFVVHQFALNYNSGAILFNHIIIYTGDCVWWSLPVNSSKSKVTIAIIASCKTNYNLLSTRPECRYDTAWLDDVPRIDQGRSVQLNINEIIDNKYFKNSLDFSCTRPVSFLTTEERTRNELAVSR